ncbi:hypothetical protein [Geminocystis herdmanii]|nr:hypothetical protein [Geminocystis herdmanii]
MSKYSKQTIIREIIVIMREYKNLLQVSEEYFRNYPEEIDA